MHHVCLCDFLLVPLGLLMNRHALPIEVKVTGAINPPTQRHCDGGQQACAHCCHLHYPPAEACSSIYSHVEHVWHRAKGLVRSPPTLFDCSEMLLHFLPVNWGTVTWLLLCHHAAVVGSCYRSHQTNQANTLISRLKKMQKSIYLFKKKIKFNSVSLLYWRQWSH